MLPDLREALRQLRKAPGYTTTAVLTLALGIGATTAIFTLVHQVMLKSLPVAKPEELWRIGDVNRCCQWGGYAQDNDFALFSWEAYNHFRKNTPEFADLAAFQAGSAHLGIRKAGSNAQADTRNGQYVSGNFFRTFGIQPWIGRLLTDADDRIGAPSVAVMSYHVWTEKYNSDPSVVGASYTINGFPFTVIGVSAPGFAGARVSGWGMPDFWLPVTTEGVLDGAIARIKQPSSNFLDIIGRIKPGVNSKTLEAKLKIEFHNWLAGHVSDMEPAEKQLWQQQTVHLTPAGAGVSDLRDSYEKGLKLLLFASACVLLIACANLANLMLARGLKDRIQTSVRVALGAPRARLIRKSVIESLLLSLIGGILGVFVAYAGSKLILYLAFQYNTKNSFIPVDASPSWPVLLFTLGVSILAGILFSVAPAWMTSHADPIEALRGANRAIGGRGSWAQKSLVVVQAALSLVLLSAAALLGQSLRNLEHQNFGFETEGRYLASIDATLSNTYKGEDMERLYQRIDERILQIPGVRSVAPVLYAPMSGDSWNTGVRIAGRPEPGAKEDVSAGWARVMPGFFETIGAKTVRGRTFSDQDTPSTRLVAVVNQAFAKRFFKNQNPVGQHFGMDRIKYAGMYEIVGVVADMRYMTWNLTDPPRPMMWFSETQTAHYEDPQYVAGESYSHFLNNIVIYAPGHIAGLETQVRRAFAEIDPTLVVYGVDSYSTVLEGDFQRENMIAKLTMLFGFLALVLAAIGLYGVMSYMVEQRAREIGVRMALGAQRNSVLNMVLGSAFFQIAIGLLIGIPAAIGAGKLMADQLFGVKFWDPLMLTVAATLLALAALAASLIPAYRAASIEPMSALRID